VRNRVKFEVDFLIVHRGRIGVIDQARVGGAGGETAPPDARRERQATAAASSGIGSDAGTPSPSSGSPRALAWASRDVAADSAS
jgi:hypothetical protein